ncbi:putative non-specific serine/threonine protein kinase [Helianthus annuus]|nr:putative non-specific serine/threonine protein kinase [Helianthus annuus]
MLSFSLELFSLLLFITSTTAQPHRANEYFLNCGSSSTITSGRKWDGDYQSEFLPSNITTTSFSSTPYYLDPSVPLVPFSTARIFNTSSFTYTFPVSTGPKFLRLYFYPATYSNLNVNQSFFSVSSNGFSLLTNFRALQAASYLAKTRSDAGVSGPQIPHFVKEFLIYVNDSKTLYVMFSPSPNSYAFINGIEIVSVPENLYFNAKTPKYVNQYSGPIIDNSTALENIYRLNMGGGQVSDNYDTAMYRSWYPDNNYIFGAASGVTWVYDDPIMYTMDTPNYTAPELV